MADLSESEVDRPEPVLPDQEFHHLRITDVVDETPDARSLVLAVPEGQEHAFTYRPGQFLTLRVPSEQTGSVARCYSLSSSPHTDRHVQVTVKRVDGGYGSNWLCENAEPGLELAVLPPAGVFTPARLDTDLLLLAGGSGITPVLSILKSALDRGTGRITLLYANRDEDSVIFAGALRQLREQHPDRLRVLHWLESVQGLPDAQALQGLLDPAPAAEAFVCGPKPFMSAASEALNGLGLARNSVHIERFRSLSRNPFEETDIEEESVAAADESTEDDAAVNVELDGERTQLSWPRGRKLLDLLLESGLDAPYSCRQGACSACACRVTSGEVKMLNNEILEQEDLDEGIVLACQSLPITDEVHVSYE